MDDTKKQPALQTKNQKWFSELHFEEQVEKEMSLGLDLYHNSSLRVSNLLQNCDLPPPLKFFSPIDSDDQKASKLLSSMNSAKPAPRKVEGQDEESEAEDHGEGNSKLLRALQLSQTRAREAEKKASSEKSRTDELVRILLQDSVKLSAYGRWLKLLEAEILMLQKNRSRSRSRTEESCSVCDGTAWCLALVVCLGFAGVGFAVGRYLWF